MSFPAVDIRPRRSMLLFAMLSIAMVIASYIFILLLAAACVYLPYLLLRGTDSPNLQLILLFLFGIAISAVMLWSLLPRFHKFEAPGLLLERDRQPRLFAELENIAAALNEPMPREVYLVGDNNAFVADRGGFLGIGSRRVMGLGLPLLSVLTVSQFRAVLAHEFAHYYGGDTSIGPWVYKTQSAIVGIFENVGSLGKLARGAILGVMYLLVGAVMSAYFAVFLRAISLASRRREYRADELACLIAGRRPLIDGLRAIHGAAPAWTAFWQTELTPLFSNGVVPGIIEGFARFTSVPQISQQIHKDLDARIREEKGNPLDSHPRLRDRIAAAEKVSGGQVADDSTLSCGLLDQVEATEVRFLECVSPHVKPGTLTSIRWEEVAGTITVPNWKKFAAEHASVLEGVTAQSLPGQVPRLRQIGAGMRPPDGRMIFPEQRAQFAGRIFAVGLALALLDNGWVLNTGPGVFNLSRGVHHLDPFRLMDLLRTGQLSSEDWRALCAGLGIGGLDLGQAVSRRFDGYSRPSP